jgi:hypothetical protein
MISGSIDPRARKARSALPIKRAVARVRPRWAKRSIMQLSATWVYNYLRESINRERALALDAIY